MSQSSLICHALNRTWLAASLHFATRRFAAALRDPVAAQTRLMRQIAQQHGATWIGQRLRLTDIESLEAWAGQVPLSSYADYAPLIERIRHGEQSVLTADPVMRLAPTGGSSAPGSPRKLIPFTSTSARAMRAAVSAWLGRMYLDQPDLMGGCAYWSVSPSLDADHDAGGNGAVPIGFEDDSEYIGGAAGWLVRRTLAVDPDVVRLRDVDGFRYITALQLLRRRDLRIISVWHPTFLSLIIESAQAHWDQLMADIERGGCSWKSGDAHAHGADSKLITQVGIGTASGDRANKLRRAGSANPGAWWPRLGVVSCWTDGHAWSGAERLRGWFGNECVRGKGLIATEAMVSIPWSDARPACVESTLVEFLETDGTPRHIGQIERGGEYELVVTTWGGLYRYRLGDRVRVDGFAERTPSLTFVGRCDRVSDLRGEKLSEAHVASAVGRGMREIGLHGFAMLAPCERDGEAGYVLFVESDGGRAAGLSLRVDTLLRENPQYDYARKLGQLRAVRARAVGRWAEAAYVERLQRDGQRLGDIKPAALSVLADWDVVFDAAERSGMND